MFVLGTAGHIDHGKSSLIRAMTGIDPDRLPEEKQRGITIDLGFAWMKLPGGSEIGLVDVPGHERFVRNMVAGAGGINAAMLVIAADDGWMPQTQEHLDILNLLDIQHGFVALTKTDLVDSDWVDLVAGDIQEKLKGSFLEKSPIVPCSAETKSGIEDVINAIEAISTELQSAEDLGKSRLFIDRSFILTGIGVVITGTSRGGGFSADTDAWHFPSGDRIRIRSLQSHERKVESVDVGTRVAINITGADRDDVKRGDVITSFPYVDPPSFFAVSIKNLSNSIMTLKEGRKVLIIHGTTETEAIIRPFPDKGIKPGQEDFAIIKTTDPLAAFLTDNFILRLPTPQVTVGGGRILDILDSYPRRKDLSLLVESLNERKSRDVSRIIKAELQKGLFATGNSLLANSNFSKEAIDTAIDSLLSDNTLVAYDAYIGLAGKIAPVAKNLIKILERTHKNKSYLRGLTAEELSRRVKIFDNAQFNLLAKHLESSNEIERENQYYRLPGFKPELDAKMETQSVEIMSAIKKAGHNYLTFEELERSFENSRQTMNFLRDNQELKGVGNNFVMAMSTWKEILGFLDKKFNDSGKISLAEFRDEFRTTRKYALPLLEYLDQIKITKRDGDFRIAGVSFDERNTL